MRRIRAAWDNSLAGRNLGGTGVYATQMIRHLKMAPDLSLEVFDQWNIARGNRNRSARVIQGITSLFWAHCYFPRLLRTHQCDVLHSPSFVTPFSCPCPSVVTVHDLTFRIFTTHFDRSWQVYLRGVMPIVLRSASAVICVSEHSKQDLLRYYNVSAKKVYVVYNGIDHSRFNPGNKLNPYWASRVGLNRDYILHVGALSYRKNIPTLLRAVAQLRSKGKFENRLLVLAGPNNPALAGAYEVYETVEQLDLASTVRFLGHVPDEHLPGLYAGASALAMPSLYEGFGFPVLESMAVGTPVVASNTSSLPEVCADAAALVPADDAGSLAEAIEEILTNPSRAERLKEMGLARAAQFSWERTTGETIAIYQTLLGS